MEMKWWESHDNLIELADWLIAERRLFDAADTLYFFEKPWKRDAEWDEMHAPEWEEKHGLENPADWSKREPTGGELFLEEDVEDRPADVIWREELTTP